MYITKFCNFENLVAQLEGVQQTEDEFVVHGYACVHNALDAVNDVLLEGAFDESLKKFSRKEEWCHMYYEHDNKIKINGLWTAIMNDDFGVKVRGIIRCPKLIQMIISGQINGLSVGFYLQEYSISNGVRYIKKGRLVEVSLVKNPANFASRFVPMNKNVQYNAIGKKH